MIHPLRERSPAACLATVILAAVILAATTPLAAAAPGITGLDGREVAVSSRPLPEGGLDQEFDLGWRLPARPRSSPGLLPGLEALVTATFELPWNGRVLRTFGDLVLALEPLGRDRRQRALKQLRGEAPDLFQRHGEALEQLLLDDQLRSESWDANDDEPRDGFLMAPTWELQGDQPGPWGQVEVERTIEQGAAFVRSDLETFKAVENDYRLYPSHRGARYDWIYPAEERYFRGEDADGNPLNTSLIVFRCDLPFPLSNYDCRLHVMNRLDERGRLNTDIYSTSRDFYYMAGMDVFLPVRAGSGDPVGFVVVRDFGFDLDGVPDKGKHRTGALRRTLGNLKLEAERRTRRGELGPIDGSVPDFVMYGVRD